MVTLLTPEQAQALEAAPFTYPEVGATATGLPAGYHTVRRSRPVRGRDLRSATEFLLRWGVQETAGLQVAASAERVTVGAVVRMTLGVGRLGLRIPCRVVHVVAEPGRSGFAYGTLPGHPESGEELFLLEEAADGSLTFTVTAFSRPATALARAGGPVARRAQGMVTTRYLAALDA